MLLRESALKGYAIAASDGTIGSVSDFLFDDTTWKVRWLVVDTGTWLTGRKVLIHPSAIGPIDYQQQELPVRLTRAQVKGSLDISQDEPVSLQMEGSLYQYNGWDPLWGGGGYFGGYPGAIGLPLAPWPYRGEQTAHDAHDGELRSDDGDPHLRSIAEVSSYHIHAVDGKIGHIETFVIEDATWGIRYFIVDTRNWWPGQHVLLSPYAAREIDFAKHEVRVDVSRDQIKACPSWDPASVIDQTYEKRLHGYYAWPGYGW